MSPNQSLDLTDVVVGSDMKPVNPVHPGEILAEVLDQHCITVQILAKKLMVPAKRLSALLDGTRGLSADIALRLAKFFDTPPYYWMILQNSYDLAIAERNNREAIGKIASMESSAGMAVENGGYIGAEKTNLSTASPRAFTIERPLSSF